MAVPDKYVPMSGAKILADGVKAYVDSAVSGLGAGGVKKAVFAASDWTVTTTTGENGTVTSTTATLTLTQDKHGLTNDTFLCQVRMNVDGIFKASVFGAREVSVAYSETEKTVVLTAPEAFSGDILFAGG